jgi:hypothetical protein
VTTAPSSSRTIGFPEAGLSFAFGIGAGLLVGFLGPLWGGLIVVMSFPLVFRAPGRVDLLRLFVGFAPVWLLLVIVGTNATTSASPLNEAALAVVGFVPLALSTATVLLLRRQVDNNDRR